MEEDTPRRFNVRPPANALPRDSEQAEAALAAFIRGQGEFWPRAELDAQRLRIEALRDPLAPESLAGLAHQLPTLSALWQRFAYEAAMTTDVDEKAKLARAALHAQQAYARTFALLHTLRHQQLGAAARVKVLPSPDSDSDTDRDSD